MHVCFPGYCWLRLVYAGVGKVRKRDNAAAWGTDSEHKLRLPDNLFYKKFAAEASRAQMAIDIFCFSSEFTDLASIAALPKYTCGQLYFYPGFNPQRDGQKLFQELSHNLFRTTGWEAVMRIRCSKGLRINSFHGHFFIRCSDLLALPQVDPDKAFSVQIAHEEGMVPGPLAFMQCALLYTSSQGERRIRVHTLAIPVVSEVVDLFSVVDGAAMAALLAKLAIEKSYTAKLDDARSALQNKLVAALREFRALHAALARSALPHNQLIFPRSLRYLPIWILGTEKCAALRGGHGMSSWMSELQWAWTSWPPLCLRCCASCTRRCILLLILQATGVSQLLTERWSYRCQLL
eukprot:jgi/Botrbrau1/16194/Bobra.354_1s0001.3